MLNFEQKQHRMDIAQQMLTTFKDESRVYGYDIETKAPSSQWEHPEELRPKKIRQVRSNVNRLLTIFFDCNGMVQKFRTLPQGRTVNKENYIP